MKIVQQILLALPVMAFIDHAIDVEPGGIYSLSLGVVSMMISMAWIKFINN